MNKEDGEKSLARQWQIKSAWREGKRGGRKWVKKKKTVYKLAKNQSYGKVINMKTEKKQKISQGKK